MKVAVHHDLGPHLRLGKVVLTSVRRLALVPVSAVVAIGINSAWAQTGGHSASASISVSKLALTARCRWARSLMWGMVNWGFAKRRVQTTLPLNSWQRPYTPRPPMVWFDGLLKPDAAPYRKREAKVIHALSTASRGMVPIVALMPAGASVSTSLH